MFRKDPAAINEWSEGHINLCHRRQERILADVYPALNEDGYLIYSTCSYSHEENEDILDWLCGSFNMESVRIPIKEEWGIVETQSIEKMAWGYRFYPGKVKGEGLFAACLQKKEVAPQLNAFKNKGNQKLPLKEIDLIQAYLQDAGNFYYFKVHDDWLCVSKTHQASLDVLQKSLYIKKSGIRIGKLIGNDLIPDHELALNIGIDKNAFLQIELNYDQAIQYLRRDNIDLKTAENGWALMAFKKQALGWAKLLPGRINNYFPKELRILAALPPKGGV